jgi:2-C-methyl-D-erythritol 4-phosphate cytidylyltransferase
MPRFAVILPAAGKSTRMSGYQKKKPFIELKGRPVWVRTAELFIGRSDVCQTILVISPDDLEWFRETYRANLAFLEIQVVAGGSSRAESVANALAAVADDAEFVAVHDAARPLLVPKWIDSVFSAAITHKAAIPGLPVTSTVKRTTAASTIAETVDRTRLVLAQTPQVFEKHLLRQAFAEFRPLASATDEASMVEAMGHPVYVVDGWPMNIKITTSEDFRLAELFVNALPKPAAGGFGDPFGDELWR